MLKIENLSVAVQGRQILHDINLHIKPGEVHVLFGPNGTCLLYTSPSPRD